jgi:hypothetical protein
MYRQSSAPEPAREPAAARSADEATPRTARVLRVALLALLTAAACTPTPRTELFVRVRAEPEVARAVTTLSLGVRGASAASPESFGPTTIFERSGGALVFPVSLGIVPRDGDPSRRFEVVVTATGTGGTRVGEARARGTFVEGRTHLLDVVLEDACIDTRCDTDETCRAGTCTNATIDVASLPLYEPGSEPSPRDAGVDAALADAGGGSDGSTEAGTPDLGTPDDGGASDAGPTRPAPSLWAVWELPGTPSNPRAYAYDATSETVLDLVTGLEWQRATNASTRPQADSVAYCDTLVLDGKDDWRLPSRIELASIVDYEAFNPAIDRGAFSATYPRQYWTRSPVAAEAGVFWLVNFADGVISRGAATSGFHARCVR